MNFLLLFLSQNIYSPFQLSFNLALDDTIYKFVLTEITIKIFHSIRNTPSLISKMFYKYFKCLLSNFLELVDKAYLIHCNYLLKGLLPKSMMD